jgi:hypothetical protein
MVAQGGGPATGHRIAVLSWGNVVVSTAASAPGGTRTPDPRIRSLRSAIRTCLLRSGIWRLTCENTCSSFVIVAGRFAAFHGIRRPGDGLRSRERRVGPRGRGLATDQRAVSLGALIRDPRGLGRCCDDALQHAGPDLVGTVEGKHEVGQPSLCSTRCEPPRSRLIDQPICSKAARTRRAFVDGQRLTPRRT